MKYLKLITAILFFIYLSNNTSYCQDITEGVVARARIINGDTVPYLSLPPVTIVGERIFESSSEKRRHNRLVRNVKIAYPYARLAGIKFKEYNEMLLEIENDSERRRVMREVENELRDQFEGDLRKLNFSQGLILIKLVDRETQHTSYEIVKDFRGAFRAVFWQSFGRVFGYNLRERYDPEGEDKDIERIVQLIEAGAI